MLLNEELGSPEEVQKAIRDMRAGVASIDRRKEYWRDDEDHKLGELFREGLGISELAVLFQRSERAIMKRIDYLRLYRRVRPARECKKQLKGCLCPDCACQNNCIKQSKTK